MLFPFTYWPILDQSRLPSRTSGERVQSKSDLGRAIPDNSAAQHAFWLIYKKMQAEERYGRGGYICMSYSPFVLKL